MSKHTPGPWNLHRPDEGDPKTGDGSFCITAKITGARDDSEMVIANAQPSDWHETPANARLIAAAPDLLEIVRELSRWYSEGTDERSGPFAYGIFGDEEDTTWAERVRNVILHAEGGHDWYARVSDAGDNFVSCNRCGAHKADWLQQRQLERRAKEGAK